MPRRLALRSAVERGLESRTWGRPASATRALQRAGAPFEKIAPAAGHDKTGVSFWIDNAGKAIGLIAGIVALGYAVGGLIVTLRMVYSGFSVDDAVGVVGQLPREFVVAAGFVPLGIATVLGGSLWVVVGCPLIAGPRLNNAYSTLGKKTDAKAIGAGDGSGEHAETSSSQTTNLRGRRGCCLRSIGAAALGSPARWRS